MLEICTLELGLTQDLGTSLCTKYICIITIKMAAILNCIIYSSFNNNHPISQIFFSIISIFSAAGVEMVC